MGLPVEADDADDDILTYTLGGAGADNFDIEPATGQILTESDLDADTDASYTVTVTATDPAGVTDEITVNITVTGVNETPEITAEDVEYAETTAEAPNTASVASFSATDPEIAGAVTLDLSGTDASLFTLTNGTLTFNSPPNFEAPGDVNEDNTYELTVGAKDADGNRGTKDIEVKVTNEDEAGTVTLSAVQPRVGVAVTASLTDIDGPVSGVTWQWNDGNNDIDEATSDTYTPTAGNVDDTLRATAMYTDPQGPEKTAFDDSAQRVAADTRNRAPVFNDQDTVTEGVQNATTTRSVAENAVGGVQVNGGVVTATDPNTGDTVSYRLGGTNASSFDIGLTTGQITVGTGTDLDYETKTSYMVTVIATDSYGMSSSIDVTITVTDVNEGPEVTGLDRTDYAENGEVAVATYTATDPEDAGAIKWSLAAGDDAEDFEIGESSGVLTFAETPDYEMAADGDTNNEYTVTVVATDADSMTTEKVVMVEVTNEEEAGTVTLSAVAPYPGVELTATHTDPDGQIAGTEWQWSRSRSKSGSYTDIEDAKAAAYTTESGDVGFYLRATVTYNDGEGEGKSAMATSVHTVQAINLPNNAPVFPDQDPDTSGDQSDTATRMVEENTDAGEDVGLPVEADDADDDILTYTLGGAGADNFDIEPATGQILTESDLDADTDASYTVTVTATDPAGVTDEITVNITVTGVNETPEITAEDVEYAETTAEAPNTASVASFSATDPEIAGAVTLDLSGTDASLFTLTNGTLTFNSPPNFEAPGDVNEDNTYELTVGAKDADGNRGTKDIEVKVTNEDEAGTVTLSAVQPRVGVAVTASLTDIDGPVSGVTWQWNDGNNDIDEATSDTYTPTAGNVDDTLRATAMYTDPQGPEKTAFDDSAQRVAADTRNRAPVFNDQDTVTEGVQNATTTRSVAENAVGGVQVNGGVVTATDPNTGDTVSYRLGGTNASSFDIGLTTGQITVGTGTDLDYETKTSYMVTVIATDSYGMSSSIDVTITVTDVNEGPEITLGGLAISGNRNPEVEERTTAVATYTAAGPNADMATWDLSGADALDFVISSAGVLTFEIAPDFENPADAGGDNTYMVTLTADDGTYMDTHDVTVMVMNVEEDGMVTLSSDMLIVGEAVTATVTDPDMVTAGTEMWEWTRADDAGFTMNAEDIAGATMASYTPVAADDGKYLRASVTYSDGYGADAAEATGAYVVTSTSNRPPAFAMATTSRDVAENSGADAVVGGPVVATDPDNDVVTYALSGADATDFSIHNTGQITVGQGTMLDFETKTTYTVTVTATDPSGETDTIEVTINVTNVGLDTPYDADDGGAIDKPEMIEAINDYLFGSGDSAISKEDMIEVINLYLFG